MVAPRQMLFGQAHGVPTLQHLPAKRRSRGHGRIDAIDPKRSSARQYHDADVEFLFALPLPVFLEEDKGPDHDVLAASGVGGRGWVDTVV